MSYPRIIHTVLHTPWAIERAWLGSIFSVLHARLFAEQVELDMPLERLSRAPVSSARYLAGENITLAIADELTAAGVDGPERDARAAQLVSDAGPGQIAYIWGSGIMGKHLSALEEACAGGLSVDRLAAEIRAARDDDNVSAVLLHLDTPGGTATGIPELSELVRSTAERKTVAAFCDSTTASAGYYAICQSDCLYATRSADVGSIGVYSAVVDYTEWCAKQGIKVELIKDGAHKAAGIMGTSLTEEQRALITARVMEISREFKATVQAARPGVTAETMQGQCFSGSAAQSAGLVDTLVTDLDEVLTDLAAIL